MNVRSGYFSARQPQLRTLAGTKISHFQHKFHGLEDNYSSTK